MALELRDLELGMMRRGSHESFTLSWILVRRGLGRHSRAPTGTRAQPWSPPRTLTWTRCWQERRM
jgi:hypothetical protein